MNRLIFFNRNTPMRNMQLSWCVTHLTQNSVSSFVYSLGVNIWKQNCDASWFYDYRLESITASYFYKCTLDGLCIHSSQSIATTNLYYGMLFIYAGEQ